MAYLKPCLEDRNVDMFAWIEGKEIVADVLTKQGSRRDEGGGGQAGEVA